MEGGLALLDWAIVAGLLVLATAIAGPRARGQRTVRDFFLGGRNLPWYAVCGSMIATEISAVTLVSLPWVVMKPGGNLTYLQLGLVGMVLARVIIAWKLVPAYYEREIYSPYDYVGARLGPRVRTMTTVLFAIGGVLAQSARVFLTALVLRVFLHDELVWLSAKTGLSPLVLAIAAIGSVAVLWTWMGGIATVVWTDLVMFVVFLSSTVIALVVIADELDGGFGLLFYVGQGAHKLDLWNFDTSLSEPYTFWAAVLATTWMGVGALGTDQLMTQRILCCRSVRDARLAVMTSSLAMGITLLVGLIGVGLFAYYERHPLEGEALALFVETKGDMIFPIFVQQVVPTGLKGLIVAGIFAAAISSVDSILAALSQATLSGLYLPWRRARARNVAAPDAGGEDRHALVASRVLVLVFGVLLCAAATAMQHVHDRYESLLDLALAMAGYTWGALLAAFLLAFLRVRVVGDGFLWSAPLSLVTVFAVAWHEPWAEVAVGWAVLALALAWLGLHVAPALRRGAHAGLVARTAWMSAALGLLLWLVRDGTVRVLGEIEGDAAWIETTIAWPWFVPIGCSSAFVLGVLLDTGRGRERPAPGA